MGQQETLDRLNRKYESLRTGFAEVPEVTVEELHQWLQDDAAATAGGQLVLVDVRSAAEQQVSRLPGPSTLTQQEFEARGPEAFVGKRIVCYCTVGYRSGQYAKQLRRRHGLDARNLRGSILAWTHGGHPLVEPPGPDGEAGRETRRVHVYSREWALQAPGYEAVVFERPLLQAVGDVARSWWAAARARLPHGGYRGGSSSGSTGSNSVGSRGPAASREDPHT